MKSEKQIDFSHDQNQRSYNRKESPNNVRRKESEAGQERSDKKRLSKERRVSCSEDELGHSECHEETQVFQLRLRELV